MDYKRQALKVCSYIYSIFSIFLFFPKKVNGGNLKERLVCYIRDNKELYKKILEFQVKNLNLFRLTAAGRAKSNRYFKRILTSARAGIKVNFSVAAFC